MADERGKSVAGRPKVKTKKQNGPKTQQTQDLFAFTES